MSIWLAKSVVIVSPVLLIVLPALIHRQTSSKVLESRKGLRERVLLTFASVGFLAAVLWIATPLLAFADYPLRSVPFMAGVACLTLGLVLLYRSHADLGANWSVTLEIHETHRLVTTGVYRHVRHPLYSALLLYATGQALVLPNWIAGPSYLVALILLFALRIQPEEQMMREQFGKEYETYMSMTKRLMPGVW